MDDLERRIRRARPLSGNRNLPLSDRARRELAELLMAADSPESASVTAPPRPRRPWFRLSLPTFAATSAILVVVAVVAVWAFTPAPVYAATPPLLEFESVDQSATALLLELSERTCEAPSEPTDPSGDTVIVTHTWTLAMEVDGDGEVESSVIRPEIVTTTVRLDGSGTIVAVAGKPFESDGVVVDDTAISGLPLWELDFASGEFGLFGDRDFPSAVDEVEGFLLGESGFDESNQSVDSIDAVESLFLERELKCHDRATLLRYLAEVPDLDVAGSTVDRLGREAVALVGIRTVSDVEQYRRYLLLDPNTGELLASETEYIGSVRADISSPAIISYFGWE